jgi:hypothetical protein
MRWMVIASTLMAPEADDCYEVRALAMYEGVGWTHYVEIVNTCDVGLACSVATDIDPEPRYDVVVEAQQTGIVRIRWGSPAPYVSPIVSCEPLEPPPPAGGEARLLGRVAAVFGHVRVIAEGCGQDAADVRGREDASELVAAHHDRGRDMPPRDLLRSAIETFPDVGHVGLAIAHGPDRDPLTGKIGLERSGDANVPIPQQADELSLLHHRQVMDLVLGHHRARLGDVRLRLDRVRKRGHDARE